MNIDKNYNERTLMWLVIIHLVFVLSGLLLAWTDLIGEGTKSKHEEDKVKFKAKRIPGKSRSSRH